MRSVRWPSTCSESRSNCEPARRPSTRPRATRPRRRCSGSSSSRPSWSGSGVARPGRSTCSTSRTARWPRPGVCGHLDAGRAIEAEVDVTRKGVPTCAEYPGEDPILVVQAPVSVLDDDLATGHPGLLRLILVSGPRSRVDVRYERACLGPPIHVRSTCWRRHKGRSPLALPGHQEGCAGGTRGSSGWPENRQFP